MGVVPSSTVGSRGGLVLARLLPVLGAPLVELDRYARSVGMAIVGRPRTGPAPSLWPVFVWFTAVQAPSEPPPRHRPTEVPAHLTAFLRAHHHREQIPQMSVPSASTSPLPMVVHPTRSNSGIDATRPGQFSYKWSTVRPSHHGETHAVTRPAAEPR